MNSSFFYSNLYEINNNNNTGNTEYTEQSYFDLPTTSVSMNNNNNSEYDDFLMPELEFPNTAISNSTSPIVEEVLPTESYELFPSQSQQILKSGSPNTYTPESCDSSNASSSANSVGESESEQSAPRIITADELFRMDSEENYRNATNSDSNHTILHEDQSNKANGKSNLGKSKGKRKKYTHITADVNNSPIIDPKLLIDPSLPKKERNKISATAYRKRRKVFLDGLEDQLMQTQNELNAEKEKSKSVETENRLLKEQLTFLKNLITARSTATKAVNKAVSNRRVDNNEYDNEDRIMNTDSIPLNSSSIRNTLFSGAISSTVESGVKQASLFLFALFSMFLLFNPAFLQPTQINNYSTESLNSLLSATGPFMSSTHRGRVLNGLEELNSNFNSILNAATGVALNWRNTPSVEHTGEQNQEIRIKKYSSLAANQQKFDSKLQSLSSTVSAAHVNAPLANNQIQQLVSMIESISITSIDHEALFSAFLTQSSESIGYLISQVYLPLVTLVGAKLAEEALKRLATTVFSQVQKQANAHGRSVPSSTHSCVPGNKYVDVSALGLQAATLF